ncbi:MAG: DUF5104 domain-containing protein, partial [Ruminiclostridium sp.]|nr:DUF5104 domain-containing protein [Ruminiclostridium sp.]
EIEKHIGFIDADIASYSYTQGGGSKGTSNFEFDYYHCYPTFKSSETITGKIYTIQFAYYYIWKEKPEYEGVSKITAFTGEDWADSDKGVTVGKYYDLPY